MKTDEHQPSEESVQDMYVDSLQYDALQGLVRCAARMGIKGDRGTTEAVVFQSNAAGIKADEWRGMFPEVNLVRHTVLVQSPEKKLTGRLKRMAEYVLKRLAQCATEISNPTTYTALGIEQRHFSTLVGKPEWQAFIASQGLQPRTLRAQPRAFARPADRSPQARVLRHRAKVQAD